MPVSGSFAVMNDKALSGNSGRGMLFDVVKRGLDIAISVPALVAAVPIILVCMLIIRISSKGSPLLKQVRLGKDGRPFTMYKLRTMYANAEAGSGPVLARANDSRIVPSCRWMRLSHVDELPQLWNVLRGQMSLVGPRPERPEIAEQVSHRLPDFSKRLAVRPGITGLAQVCNGYDTCMDAFNHKLNYDLDYIRRRSLSLELWILAKTTTKVCDPTAH